MNLKDWISALVRWCCQKPKKKTSVTPTRVESFVITPDPVLLSFTLAAATLTIAGNAPQDLTLTADPVDLTFAVADAFLSASGSLVMTPEPVNLTFTVAPATLQSGLNIRPAAVDLAFTVAPATLTVNPVLTAGPVNLSFEAKAANLSTTDATASYPESVASAGLSAVWDLKTTAGPSSAPSKSLSGGGLPVNVTNSDKLYIKGFVSPFDGWIVDKPVYTQGTGTYSVGISNCSLSLGSIGDYNVRNGKDDGSNAVTLTMTDCDIDASTTTQGWGGINSHEHSTVNLSGCNFTGAARDYVTLVNGNLTDCYLGTIGNNPISGQHLEHLFVDGGGTVNIVRCFLDGRAGPVGNWTGNIQIGGSLTGASTTNITDSILAGAADCESAYAIQYRTDAHDVTINLSNVVIQKGGSGYIGRGPGTNPATINASGCTDYDTGDSIDATLMA